MPRPAEPTARRVGIADVAKALGVSEMTVSRVLNDRPGVGAATRSRVREHLDALGFRPHPAARSLRLGRTQSVGFVSPSAELVSPLARALVGAQRTAEAEGLDVTLVSLDDLTEVGIARARAHLQRNGVEALLMISSMNDSVTALQELAAGIPAVGLWTPDDGIFSLGAADNRDGARTATRHLIDLGHRKIGHIAGPPGSMATDNRRLGWERELGDAGLPLGPVAVGDWSAASGATAATALLTEHSDLTAVFVANDTMAVGVLHAAHRLRRPIPQTLSIVGYDDVPESAYTWPPLTTVREDFERLGARALAAALAQSRGRATEIERVRPDLIIRETTTEPH